MDLKASRKIESHNLWDVRDEEEWGMKHSWFLAWTTGYIVGVHYAKGMKERQVEEEDKEFNSENVEFEVHSR